MGGMGGMMNPMMQMMQQQQPAGAEGGEDESAYGSYGGPLQPGLGQVPRHNVNTPKTTAGPQRSQQRHQSNYKPY